MSNNHSQNRFARTLDWEDAQAVLDVCCTVQGAVVSVAGGGDIALSLLTKSFSSLTVVASNETERMLFELKLKAIQSLHPDNVYNLIGIHPGGRRVFVYHQLREALSSEAKLWWDRHENFIREGILESGQQEKHHQRLKKWMKWLRLNMETIPISSLQNHKRWTLLDPILRTIIDSRPHEDFWQNDNPYAHMLLNHQWDVDLLQSRMPSLSYEGMQSIQRSKMGLLMITGSFSGWMETEPSGTMSIVYLGVLSDIIRTQSIDRNFWRKVSDLLLDNGAVLCWSPIQPSAACFRWQQYEGLVRSVHSGLLWIGRKA